MYHDQAVDPGSRTLAFEGTRFNVTLGLPFIRDIARITARPL